MIVGRLNIKKFENRLVDCDLVFCFFLVVFKFVFNFIYERVRIFFMIFVMVN